MTLRDDAIRERVASGEMRRDVAKDYGLSPTRISQITQGDPPKSEKDKKVRAALKKKRRETGLCVRCGERAVPGHRRCEEHLAKDRARRLAWTMNPDACPRCGNPSKEDMANGNGNSCSKCRDYIKIWYERHGDRLKERAASLKAEGICRCGKRPLAPGRARCEVCLGSMRRYATRIRRQRKMAKKQADMLMESGATFSDDELFRWTLWRIWDRTKRLIIFCGLNPSTADETKNDPTVRREIGYAQRWGYGGLIKLNAFAYRATDPHEMKRQPDPVGFGNRTAFFKAAETVREHDFNRGHFSPPTAVCAWGVHGAHRGQNVVAAKWLWEAGAELSCFGFTKDGHPKHPLYLPKSAPLVPFPLPAREAR